MFMKQNIMDKACSSFEFKKNSIFSWTMRWKNREVH